MLAGILLGYSSFFAKGQPVYQLHHQVDNLTFVQVLNASVPISDLKSIEADIIVLDFFGTWCGPCIKALPHLAGLQKEFGKNMKVLLISNESEVKLRNFIDKRAGLPFPVVRDADHLFTNSFAPPSYPYTVVLNKDRKIIGIGHAADINANTINTWLTGEMQTMKNSTVPSTPVPVVSLATSNRLVQLSQNFVYATKTDGLTDSLVKAIGDISYQHLVDSLASDEEKIAFWINLYNAFTHAILSKHPDKFNNRNQFFKAKQIAIAGKKFSLDFIEHGILRRSKIKWGLGYLNKWFPGKIEKQLRVEVLDYRIHFALNCGAKSCPPIAFYNPENINPQLEQAALFYLQNEVSYSESENTLYLPAIMSWFRGDFGGKKKMIALIKRNGIIQKEIHPTIKFKAYDWTLYTNNFK